MIEELMDSPVLETLLVFERYEHQAPASPLGWLVRFAETIPRIHD